MDIKLQGVPKEFFIDTLVNYLRCTDLTNRVFTITISKDGGYSISSYKNNTGILNE